MSGQFLYKTRSEQRLEQIEALARPLTEAEVDELQRVLHAIYCRNRKLARAYG